MPPREASGTFPDQYLTFDFEPSMGLGAPPVHEPFPTGAGMNNNTTTADTNDTNNLLLQEDESGAGAGGNGGGNHHHNHHHHNQDADSGSGSNVRTAMNTASQVDPLSIDPTANLNNNNNNNNVNRNTWDNRPRMPDLSFGQHSTQTTLRNVTTRTASTLLQQQQQQQPSMPRRSVVVSPHSSVSASMGATETEVPAVASDLTTGTNSSSSSSSASSSRGSSRGRGVLLLSMPPRSVLDHTTSMEMSEDDEGDEEGVPGLDVTYDSHSQSQSLSRSLSHSHSRNVSHSGSMLLPSSASWEQAEQEDDDEDDDDESQEHLLPSHHTLTHLVEDDQSAASPVPISSADSTTSSTASSVRTIQQTTAFDMTNDNAAAATAAPQRQHRRRTSRQQHMPGSPASPNSSLSFSFGPNTTVSDLKYFAERGCIVALLQALNTPRLVTLGTRMLADYAKMSHRRVAVASNRRILEFVQQTMLTVTTTDPSLVADPEQQQSDWLGREYAVETVRSLTATEESDRYLMGSHGLLETLALVARGGPFVVSNNSSTDDDDDDDDTESQNQSNTPVALASEKARLHACIAIMNLSCGKANKIEIAKIPEVLEAMREVMLHSNEEARLKATTCIKNLSNADANDAALLGTRGLVEALGHVAATTCTPETGATPCTTNACLALMNLSISKANKHRVFRTSGVMESLMTVLERTTAQGSSTEARIKACSALSNLAIGYDNKIPMFHYPGFVDAILNVIQTDTGEARTKACSILWSFAAEMKNQVPVVRRGDILPVLVQVAEEDGTTEARFKCVAALTLLAESSENAIPLLESGALSPLMDILHQAGPDPTQWKGQTASWCVGFLMNIAQSDEAVLTLREAGVVELLAPLLTLDHYQSLKAAMAVTFVCRYDEGDECYDLLRKTENVIPKIISLLHNTLSGRGGNGYKYGVFTLRSSVGCIAALASGPDFMKERIATGPVFESLLRVLSDFCVDGGTPGAIVGGGRDDVLSATLAVRATQSLTAHLIPTTGCSALPFGQSMEDRLLTALESFETSPNRELTAQTRSLATDAKVRIQGGRHMNNHRSAVLGRFMMGGGLGGGGGGSMGHHHHGHNNHCVGGLGDDGTGDVDMNDMASLASHCCGLESLPGFGGTFLESIGALPQQQQPQPQKQQQQDNSIVSKSSVVEEDTDAEEPVRTFLLADARTGRRFAVPTDPSGGRAFNDNRVWCYRRGRFCLPGEQPDPNFVWTDELQQAYEAALVTVMAEEEEEEAAAAAAALAVTTSSTSSSHSVGAHQKNDGASATVGTSMS